MGLLGGASSTQSLPAGFTVEVVGVSDVRIVFESQACLLVTAVKLVLRNVLLYDRSRRSRRFPGTDKPHPGHSLQVEAGGALELVDVKINAPAKTVVFVKGEGTRCCFTDSLVSDCGEAFAVADKAAIDFKGSVIRNTSNWGGHLFDRTSLVAFKSSFIKHRMFNFAFWSTADFKDCTFVGSYDAEKDEREQEAMMAMMGGKMDMELAQMLMTPKTEEEFQARCREQKGFMVIHGSTIAFSRCSFNQYLKLLDLYELGTEATVERCSARNMWVLLGISEGACGTATDNSLHLSCILDTHHNTRGKVILKRNKFFECGRCKPSCENPPEMQRDEDSTNLDHDIRGLKVDLMQHHPMTRFDTKTKSAFTKDGKEKIRTLVDQGLIDDVLCILKTNRYKICKRCNRVEA